MDLLTVLATIALAVVVYFALKPPTYPGVPGPSLRDYLPGGVVYEVFEDRRKYLHTLTRLSDIYGDVFQAWIGTRQFVFTSMPEDMVHVLNNRSDFERLDSVVAAFNTTSPGSIMTMSREKHLAARKTLRKSLHHAMMRDFHPAMLAAVGELVDEFERLVPAGRPSDVLDINEMLSAVTFRVILNVAFGAEMDREQRVQFAKTIDSMTKSMSIGIVYYPIPQLLRPFGALSSLYKNRDFLRGILKEIVQKRHSESAEARANRANDFLDALIEVEGDDIEATVSQATFVAAAGAHTTNIVMSWCLYHLHQNPGVVAKIHTELDSIAKGPEEPFTFEDVAKMEYLRKVWKETLRLSPATGFTSRKAVRDVKLEGSGVRVPKNGRVGVFFMRRHMDEKYWTQPKKFIPERWGTPENPGEGDTVPAGCYLPFSIGVRNCVGQMLADYEGILVLAELLRRFKFILPCEPSEVVRTFGVVMAGRYSSKKDGVLDMGIPMRVERR